jgi:hypothetical protein
MKRLLEVPVGDRTKRRSPIYQKRGRRENDDGGKSWDAKGEGPV